MSHGSTSKSCTIPPCNPYEVTHKYKRIQVYTFALEACSLFRRLLSPRRCTMISSHPQPKAHCDSLERIPYLLRLRLIRSLTIGGIFLQVPDDFAAVMSGGLFAHLPSDMPPQPALDIWRQKWIIVYSEYTSENIGCGDCLNTKQRALYLLICTLKWKVITDGDCKTQKLRGALKDGECMLLLIVIVCVLIDMKR